MRYPVFALVLVALAACSPEIPESGVGFENYPDYVRRREAELSGQQGLPTQSAPLSAISVAPVEGASPYPAPASTAPAARGRAEAPAGIAIERGEVGGTSPGISDEQDFGAVASRETIESDKQRLEAQRQVYQTVAPTALPPRTTSDAPDIIRYALDTRNPLGQSLYRRSGRVSPEALANKCARYNSQDHAQEVFLASGGPKRDPKGIDPDGDGFACFWDPEPFRNALR